ncbi:hypothetical protein C1645_768080 [Glomus cerebriforme]|uniref:Uncharacterized protein n=1 Tax=Glomus cerebriforme TaxID=658196 RepID=A0A397T2R5_9GLOM|nr:hypothetical protein C1645_768080 [Glomus cerebriforme]
MNTSARLLEGKRRRKGEVFFYFIIQERLLTFIFFFFVGTNSSAQLLKVNEVNGGRGRCFFFILLYKNVY